MLAFLSGWSPAYSLRAMPTTALRASRHAIMTATATCPKPGDVVTVKYSLRPSEERLFDEGTVSFVLDEGGYLPGLHKEVASMSSGESREGVSVDAGFGEYIEAAKATPCAPSPIRICSAL